MAIVLSCPCGQQMQVRESAAGRTMACPSCKRIASIPTGTARQEGSRETTHPAGLWLVAVLVGLVALSGGMVTVLLLNRQDPPPKNDPIPVVANPPKRDGNP